MTSCTPSPSPTMDFGTTDFGTTVLSACSACGSPAALAPRARTIEPAPIQVRIISSAAAILSLVSNMVLSAPCVKAATLVDTTAVAAPPAATIAAALIVDVNNCAGTAAEAKPSARNEATSAPVTVKPR